MRPKDVVVKWLLHLRFNWRPSFGPCNAPGRSAVIYLCITLKPNTQISWLTCCLIFQVLHSTINSKGINGCSVDIQLKACRWNTIVQQGEEPQQQQQPICLVLQHNWTWKCNQSKKRNGMVELFKREGPGLEKFMHVMEILEAPPFLRWCQSVGTYSKIPMLRVLTFTDVCRNLCMLEKTSVSRCIICFKDLHKPILFIRSTQANM